MKYAAFLLAMAIALPAAADEVVLRNGSRLEGQVTQTDKEIVIIMDIGTVTLKRSEVASVVAGKSTIQEFDEKLKGLDSGDLDGRYQLAVWGKQHGLDNRAERLLRDIISVDPEHAAARAELGYQKRDGRWMTEDEIRIAEGFVKFRGAWIKKTEAEEILQREREQADAASLAAAQKELIEAEAAYTRAKAEAERIRAEIERETNELSSGFRIVMFPLFRAHRSFLRRDHPPGDKPHPHAEFKSNKP